MLEKLKFVRGAVSDKDLVPVLTCFHIYDGRIQGSNGRIAIDVACPELEGINITVPADRFLKAVDACAGEPKLKVTENGNLTVSRGKFRTTIPLVTDKNYPLQQPEGEQVDFPDGKKFMQAMKILRKFCADDMQRPWACGVLLSDRAAYATNNVVIAKHDIDVGLYAEVIVPFFSVDELLRIGKAPTGWKIDARSVTFFYEDGWFKTQLFEGEWPEIERFFEEQTSVPVLEGMLMDVEKIKPFCPDKKVPVIKLTANGISTLDDATLIEGREFKESAFRIEPLLAVLQVAKFIDFEPYPGPCPFRGDGIQGVIMGMRLA